MLSLFDELRESKSNNKTRGVIIMTVEQRIKNLSVPRGIVDVVLDTDAYNEIDDQFAISYLIKSKEKLNTKAMMRCRNEGFENKL